MSCCCQLCLRVGLPALQTGLVHVVWSEPVPISARVGVVIQVQRNAPHLQQTSYVIKLSQCNKYAVSRGAVSEKSRKRSSLAALLTASLSHVPPCTLLPRTNLKQPCNRVCRQSCAAPVCVRRQAAAATSGMLCTHGVVTQSVPTEIWVR